MLYNKQRVKFLTVKMLVAQFRYKLYRIWRKLYDIRPTGALAKYFDVRDVGMAMQSP
jgi:hypothetical protein